MWGLCIFAANQSFMKKKLPITKNKDVVVSWVYTWSKQQDMSIH
ncbi:replication initiation protein, partial [Bacteroides thetaiotaomicron]